ncbi:MAG: hypothetical protein PF569_02215, partial [Candidatus Woesearchaeota archaeon]|nr:hypothetical protein [Candidatus Woesearchaeota archaeon]
MKNSKVIYKSLNYKIEIICPIHGSFWQLPSSHLYHGHSCPKCSTSLSKGEERIIKYLESKNIN